jgi:DNA primase
LIPEEIINRVRERADIVEVVGSHLSLTKTGQNFKGLCPFHTEKTPSFTVSPSRQMFHCFGCGEGGSVFTFLMKLDGSTFPSVVRALGEKYGIPVDPPVQSRKERQQTEARDRLFTLNRQAAEFFRRTLLTDSAAEPARVYLEKRGISAESIERFGIGYAPPGWDRTLKTLLKGGALVDDLLAAGLVVPREQRDQPLPQPQIVAKSMDASRCYDRFRGRVMVPIRDLQKRVIGFGGRAIDGEPPKYLNSPETPLFSKGRVLYGLDSARDGIGQFEQIVVVEGYFDAIALHQFGLTNAVATLGTALTPEHVALIRRFTTRVVLLFDPDPAGVKAALRAMDLFLGSGLTVQVGSLPASEDPDSFVRARGAEAFLELIRRARTLLEFTVQATLPTRSQGSQASIEERVRAVEEILVLLQKLDNPVEKAASIRHVADQLGLDEKVLVERYRALPRRPSPATPVMHPPQAHTNAPDQAPAVKAVQLHKAEQDLLLLLLHDKLAPEMVARLAPDDFTDVRAKRLVSVALDAQNSESGEHAVEEHQAHLAGSILARILEHEAADPPSEALARSLSLTELPYEDAAAAFRESLTALKLQRLADEIQQVKSALAAAEQAGEVETGRMLLLRRNALQQERQRLLKPEVSAAR